MKRGFTGKRYFAWLGWMDAQAGGLALLPSPSAPELAHVG